MTVQIPQLTPAQLAARLDAVVLDANLDGGRTRWSGEGRPVT